MQTLFTNAAISIGYDGGSMILHSNWKADSLKISEDFFKSVNLKYVEIAEKMPVRGFFIDTVNFQFTISPATQEWVAHTILPKLIALGCKKVAFLQSEDFVAQLSIEQTMSERDDLPFQVLYFSDKNEALQWLSR